jgi:hypothetical protein
VTYAKVWADVRYDYEKTLRETKRSRSNAEIFHDDERTAMTGLRSFVKNAWDMIRAKSDFSHPQMRMPFSELTNLIVRLPPPLGLQGVRNLTRADTLRVIKALQIPVNANGEIHYHTTLSALLDRVVLGDVVNKTLKQSLMGEQSPQPLPMAMPLNGKPHADSKTKENDDLLGRVTDELRELLHLQIPPGSVQYRQVIEVENERHDGHDAATLIATKLLHKAAARYLKRKKELARRSTRLSSHVRRHSAAPRSAAAVVDELQVQVEESEETLPEKARGHGIAEGLHHVADGLHHVADVLKMAPHNVTVAASAGVHAVTNATSTIVDNIHQHMDVEHKQANVASLAQVSARVMDDAELQ